MSWWKSAASRVPAGGRIRQGLHGGVRRAGVLEMVLEVVLEKAGDGKQNAGEAALREPVTFVG